MLKKTFLYLKNFDWTLFASILLLACFGLVEIYSIALGREAANLTIFKKQIFFILIGIIIVFVLIFLDYRLLKDYANYLYALGAVILISILLLGLSDDNTTRWFHFGYFNFQPVELVKIIFIIFLAKFFSSSKIAQDNWKYLLWSGIFAFFLFFLVALQPDFGSGMVFFAIWLILAILTGFKKKYFILIFIIGILAFGGMWSFYFVDYQKNRILAFIKPSESSIDQRYNVDQAIIAVGSGGMIGEGVGFGSQSQLKFLPEVHTDFIFAVIAEELGFVGVTLLLAFFGLFFYRCLANLKNIKHDFGIFLILGGAGLIFIQMFINIGMNMGIFPVVGIPLPFVSYGGSAMISNFILIGIIESIIIKSKLNY